MFNKKILVVTIALASGSAFADNDVEVDQSNLIADQLAKVEAGISYPVELSSGVDANFSSSAIGNTTAVQMDYMPERLNVDGNQSNEIGVQSALTFSGDVGHDGYRGDLSVSAGAFGNAASLSGAKSHKPAQADHLNWFLTQDNDIGWQSADAWVDGTPYAPASATSPVMIGDGLDVDATAVGNLSNVNVDTGPNDADFRVEQRNAIETQESTAYVWDFTTEFAKVSASALGNVFTADGTEIDVDRLSQRNGIESQSALAKVGSEWGTIEVREFDDDGVALDVSSTAVGNSASVDTYVLRDFESPFYSSGGNALQVNGIETQSAKTLVNMDTPVSGFEQVDVGGDLNASSSAIGNTVSLVAGWAYDADIDTAQINLVGSQSAVTQVRRLDVDGATSLSATAVGNVLSLEVDAEMDLSDNYQMNAEYTQSARTFVGGSALNGTLDASSVAIGNSISIDVRAGDTDTFQHNYQSSQMSKVTAINLNAMGDVDLSATSIGNIASISLGDI